MTAAMSEAFPDRTEEFAHPRTMIGLKPPKAPRSRPSLRVIGSYHLGGPGKGGRCPNFPLTCHSEGDVCFQCLNSRLTPQEWRYFLRSKHIVAGKFNSILEKRGSIYSDPDILEEGV